MSHIGYKKCIVKDICPVIVKLEILGKNNESRTGIGNSKFAKFRCSKARVLGIYDYGYDFGTNNIHINTTEFSSAVSIYNQSFQYTVGQIVEVDNYDNNINEVCATGIHYFLSGEVALMYWGRQYIEHINPNTLKLICFYDENGVRYIEQN